MGLREVNAERTRRHIADAALTLFLDHGYDETTMEDVAKTADVGLSTLYRYFPTKEDLAVAPLGPPTLMAEAVLARPAEEPAGPATGHAVLTMLGRQLAGARATEFRELLFDHPRLRSRVLEWLDESHRHLTGAIAARRGSEPDDPSAEATAWLAVLALQQVAVKARVDSREAADIGRDVLATMATLDIERPAPPSQA